MLSTSPCSLSPLTSRVFSQTLDVLSHLSSLTQFASVSTEKLVLSRLHCNGYSLLLSSYLTGIENQESFMQCLRTSVPGHLSSHSALSSSGFFAPLALWQLSISTTSGPGPGGVFRLFTPHGLPPSPIPRKGSRNNNSSFPIL